MRNILSQVVNIDDDKNKRTLAEAAKAYPKFREQFEIQTNTATDVDGTTEGTVRLADLNQLTNAMSLYTRNAIVEFIITTLLAIRWYDEHMKAAYVLRIWYGLLSIVIMVAIPFGIFFTSSWLGAGTWFGASGLLTGVLGLQKLLASWLDQHRRYGERWRARAGLRDIVYGLHSKWCGRAIVTTDGTAAYAAPFIGELISATADARKLIRAEQQSFFDTYTFPTPDILSGLGIPQFGVTPGVPAGSAATTQPAMGPPSGFTVTQGAGSSARS